MPQNNPIHNSALVPIYRWRGARPWLFDLESYQQGWLICLHLTREGDASFIPLAWEQFDAAGDDRRVPYPAASLHTNALHNQALSMTLREMEQDGWQLNGRFDIYFTGKETDPNFHQTIQKSLWQTPKS